MTSLDCDQILFVAPSAYPMGGVAVWLHYLVDGLTKRGVACHVGLVDGDYHNVDSYLLEYSFNCPIIRIKNLSNTQYGRVDAIKNAVLDVEATTVVSVNIPDVFEAVTQLKLTGRKIRSVMTLHALEADYFGDIKQLGCQIDAVIVTNELTRKMISSYTQFDQKRVFYAPYGVEVTGVLEQKEMASPVVISFIGRLDQDQKRCMDLLEFVEYLEASGKEYVLQIIGEGNYKRKLLNKMSSFIDNDKVVYLGKLPNKQLMDEILPQTDVLILTSSWETGPIVIWEAMSRGVVVLSSRYIGSESEKALVHKLNCLLFDIGDIKGAVKALDFLNNERDFQALRKQAYQMVTLRYSRKSSIDQWFDTFNSIAKNTSLKLADSRVKRWASIGRIEHFFGHKWGHKIRMITGKLGYLDSAGSEWPHSYAHISSDEKNTFDEALARLEIRAK